ncbi:Pimeloyl-ACP methyl ester carboxylesterase [Chryseobacterium arachidis]|uniref:Pimeloyl-ACP methyl ester carboxylesterase n=1 Tax=Chryseobacterium arachidis TaxID=1416778 RepID=A0A1M4ZN26_9FLAO|nr:alpha/beta fold hydrolase [Chryseobacterium arachidis]SHF19418.1 Pimeloyl-ACP methyl ester carboxylesterase [Chryseobacterium arachidis]
MKKINILFLLFSAFYFNAQVVSGTVVSRDEKIPIPYVKIGVEKESVGAISDEKGIFSIDLSKANTSHKVKIDVAGYESFSQGIKDFIKENPQKIILTEKVRDIKEVKLAPKKLVDKNWGVNTKTKSVTYSVNPDFNNSNFLGETALEFNASKRSKIKNINLNISKYTSNQPVMMRYSIYSEKNGMPDKNILEEEITVELTEDMIKDGTFTLDVNDRNIWVQGKFFIGIQFLKRFEGRINISAALFRTGYIREFYGDWMKMSIAAPAINIDVKVDKNGKNIKDEMKENSDKASMLFPDLSQYNIESENSIYGKNDAVGKMVKLNDAELYYEIYGEGEPLVLLHGNGGSIKEFYKQIPELSKKFKVIAIDTRAQGKSKDFTNKDLNYKIFTDDLKNLMDHLNISKTHILGWSDGGNSGLEFALKYPQNINKLIVIGANVFPEGLDEDLLKEFKGKFRMMQLANQPENENEKRLLNLMLKEPNINKKSLHTIQTPVLVLAGEKDVIKRDHTEMIAKEIPNAKLKIYPKASHYLPFEIADELNKDVIDFLKN